MAHGTGSRLDRQYWHSRSVPPGTRNRACFVVPQSAQHGGGIVEAGCRVSAVIRRVATFGTQRVGACKRPGSATKSRYSTSIDLLSGAALPRASTMTGRGTSGS